MSERLLSVAVPVLGLCFAAAVLGMSADDKPAGKERFFEMRTYIAAPGKLEALNARALELLDTVGLLEFAHWLTVELPYGRAAHAAA